MELLLSAIGGEMVAIPYKGSAPELVDVMSGTVPFMFDALSSATTYVTSGRFRALAVGSSKRSMALPNVPTTAKSEIPALTKFEVVGWVGLVAPKGTPKPVIELLPGERLGLAGGGSRLSDEYWERQKRLESGVELARERLSAALERWNELR